MKKDKEGKGKVCSFMCVCVVEKWRERNGDKTMEGQSGVKEKKVIIS